MTSDAVRFWALGLQTALDNFGAVIREWLFEDEISKHGGEKCLAISHDTPPPHRRNMERVTPRAVLTEQRASLCGVCSSKTEETTMDIYCLLCNKNKPNLRMICERAARETRSTPKSGDRLCYLCSQFDFCALFQPTLNYIGQLPSSDQKRLASRVINRDWAMVEVHANCPFCRLLFLTLDLSNPAATKSRPFIRGYVEEYAGYSVPNQWLKFLISPVPMVIGRRLWVAALNRNSYEISDDGLSRLRESLEIEFDHCI
jgi:hypothetical protein